MNRALPVALLALTLLSLLPAGDATHAVRDEERPFGRLDLVTAHFEFDQTAARPPTDLDGVLVLESRSQAATLNGTIFIDGPLAETPPPAETQQDPGDFHGGFHSRETGEPLVGVDEHLEPYTTVRIPFSTPIRSIGYANVNFHADLVEGGSVRTGQVQVYGVAPIEVSLDSPAPNARLVSVPNRPAEVVVTLTALAGSNLTDLELTGFRGYNPTEDVDIGNLAHGKSFTATLKKEADAEGPLGFRSVRHSAIIPELHGSSDGERFSHPLYRTVQERLELIHPAVYIAPESTLFLIPPQEPRLNEPTTLDVMALNAGTKALHANGQVTLSLPGMPHLDTTFDVDVRVEAGEVETLHLDWTPPAAGPWQASVRHDLGKGREPQIEQIRVSGPITHANLQVPAPLLERGKPVTVSIVLTASQNLSMEGLSLTMAHAPQGGVISIDDLLDVQSVQATTLDMNTPATIKMDLTPKATGQHNVYLVVETPEGPSVHSVNTLTVTDSTGGWPMAWSPTLLVGLLVGLHMSWRRWWVT